MAPPAASLTDLYREGTWALVTGASAGLGILFARGLAERGCHLILAARTVEKLEKVAEEIKTQVKDGGRGKERSKDIEIVCLHADLGAVGGANELIKTIRDKGLQPLIVVNNAGSGTFGDLDEISEEKIQIEMTLMTSSIVLLTRAFLRDMKEAHRGGILNISSIGGWLPIPWGSIYAGSKAFIRHFTTTLHAELKGTHPRIRCCVSCPGPVLTDIWEKAGGIDGTQLGFIEDAQTVVDRSLAAFDKDESFIITGWMSWCAIKFGPLAPLWVTDIIARRWARMAVASTGSKKVDQTPVELKRR